MAYYHNLRYHGRNIQRETFMLIDTHCHINTMVKKAFDVPMTDEEYILAGHIVTEAENAGVTTIINVGTSLVESENCIQLSQRFKNVYATIGIHPNDLNDRWKDDLSTLTEYLKQKEKFKIVGIGECGMDMHYPGYNLERQREAFKKQIELALEHDLALVVHTRDAAEETLGCLEEYKNSGLRGTIHCFSEDLLFAQTAISWGFKLGIGGTISYPKNAHLRAVIRAVGLESLLLETDAPFLPPQTMRGKQNHPQYITTIAHYVADELSTPFSTIAQITSQNAALTFKNIIL